MLRNTKADLSRHENREIWIPSADVSFCDSERHTIFRCADIALLAANFESLRNAGLEHTACRNRSIQYLSCSHFRWCSGNWCHGNPHNWSSSYRMQHHMDCLSLQEPCHGVLHQWCPFRSSGGIVPVGAGYVSLRWANADVVWDNLEF